jgi:NADPH:quinone reductase-like Zn-dependent oxidoreductase
MTGRVPLTNDPSASARSTIHKAATGLWVKSARQYELQKHALLSDEHAALPPDHALIRTLYSGVSRGTERLVLNGLVPESEYQRMRAPMQRGHFPFPVLYGYASVGVVEAGPEDLIGQRVFCLHPHQNRFIAPCAMLNRVPERIPSERATLAANMETALNALWDSGANAGDRITVIGGGLVGLLLTSLVCQLPGAEVVLVDPLDRDAMARSFGARWMTPGQAKAHNHAADVVFHTSANPQGLVLALELAGFGAKIIEMSWYGQQQAALPLGQDFHARRLQIISAQVGHLPPSHSTRWTFKRRMAKALELLDDARLDALLTPLSFADAPAKLPELLQSDSVIAPVLTY